MTDAPTPYQALPKRYSLLDIIVIIGAALGVISTLLVAYNSYNAKFTDLDKQLYEYKIELNNVKNRVSFTEEAIKLIQASEDRMSIDTRQRLDAISKSISELSNEITKGIYNANPPSRRDR